MHIDELRTPSYVVNEDLIENNLQILHGVKERTGCHILLAQKAFSMFSMYPQIAKVLDGTAASGLYEAKLGKDEMDGQVHVFSAGYRDDEIDEICEVSDHIVFNSFNQLERFGETVKKAGASIGLRINPECSTQDGHAIYDPCAYGSRLGITRENFKPELLDIVDGLHFHTLCEQNSDALETTLCAVEEKFGEFIHGMKWINFGGGHHITREDYDIDTLVRCIKHISEKYSVQVILEPGEAIALNAGFLICSVLDVVKNGTNIAILDTSAACHMPDVLEMPYRPPLLSSGEAGEKRYTYRLGGPTCLAGDIIGDYSFDKELKVSDRLTFGDMAIYSMVKNNTFNGMPLPSIAISNSKGECRVVREFGYEDFKMRLS